MTEMDKLENYLKDHGFQYERIIDEGISRGEITIGCRNQIIVYRNKKRDWDDWDAICQPGSYGYEQGLLEVMGSRVVRPSDGDSVCGYLTAQQVIDRLEVEE